MKYNAELSCLQARIAAYLRTGNIERNAFQFLDRSDSFETETTMKNLAIAFQSKSSTIAIEFDILKLVS